MTTNLVCSEAVHAALVADQDAYHALKFLGVAEMCPAELGVVDGRLQVVEPAMYLEYRNCSCHSTLTAPPRGIWRQVCDLRDYAQRTDAIATLAACNSAMRGDAIALRHVISMLELDRLSGMRIVRSR